jgi:4-amino-4-deoxychorismate lyase
LSAPLAVWVDGKAVANSQAALDVMDRGLNYGDGLFETTLIHDGAIRFIDSHLARLREGCERLRISCPDRVLLEEIVRIASTTQEGILKIVLTRGSTGRGYRPDPSTESTRILSLHPMPSPNAISGLRLRWCQMRLSRNERLAGLKHLNRLEQVLAQSEWQPQEADEGLMMDTAGEVVCVTAANLFVVREGVLITPDLRYCGVEGVMRAQVLRAAEALHLSVSVEPIWPDDLTHSSELFITNAVRGIRSAASLSDIEWTSTAVADRLRTWLKL